MNVTGRPTSAFKPRPETAPKVYNSATEPCDMDWGPCACGAWHYRNDEGGEA